MGEIHRKLLELDDKNRKLQADLDAVTTKNKKLLDRLSLIEEAIDDDSLTDSVRRIIIGTIAHGQDPLTPEQQAWAEGVVKRLLDRENDEKDK